jgi:hypothetical protein
MLSSWSAKTYWMRSRQWREKAEELPPGKEREGCLTLAEGYASLAKLLETGLLTSTQRVDPDH